MKWTGGRWGKEERREKWTRRKNSGGQGQLVGKLEAQGGEMFRPRVSAKIPTVVVVNASCGPGGGARL